MRYSVLKRLLSEPTIVVLIESLVTDASTGKFCNRLGPLSPSPSTESLGVTPSSTGKDVFPTRSIPNWVAGLLRPLLKMELPRMALPLFWRLERGSPKIATPAEPLLAIVFPDLSSVPPI